MPAPITADQGLIGMLRNYYAKDGLENLLYRNDPLLKQIKKERIEGKTANFSALYSRGGAVSANFITAKALATKTAQAAEFQVEPGQLFSACSFNNKELLASKTMRGGYLPIATAKLFAANESFRKTLALSLYGSGHGELYTLGAETSFTASTETDLTMPKHAIMAIDIGSSLEVKTAIDATSAATTLEVIKIVGTTVTVKPDTTYTAAETCVVCLAGCTDSSGNGLLPMGLDGWIPATNTGLSTSFFGVNRSVARDRLAGSLISATSGEAKYKTIERGIMELRRMGSNCDLIVMNDEDYIAMSQEIEAKTYFTKVDGGKKASSVVGRDGFGFAVSSNWVENVLDSPYCPQGKAYILDSETVKLWTYTNADKVVDGIVNNEPGKPEVTAEDESGKPFQALVNDCMSILPGVDTWEGPASLVTLQLYGSFVVTNPSVNGVVLFA